MSSATGTMPMKVGGTKTAMADSQACEGASKLLDNNRIFGYQVLPGDGSSTGIMFAGASLVQDPSSAAWGVRFFASPHTSLQSFVSNEEGLCAYVWGIPAHPDVRPSDIPAWCASVVAGDQYARFRDLVGTFV